ncbi:MAG: ABC transporter permease subunit [bacterium]
MGVLFAVHGRFYAPRGWARAQRRVVELLAGIPSVVYGFWGPHGAGAADRPRGAARAVAAGGHPHPGVDDHLTVALLADAALAAVPAEQLQSAAALGMRRWAIARGVALPAARAGITTGLLLALGRAVGETMALLMVCGNVVQVPESLADPVRTLAANVALEDGVRHGGSPRGAVRGRDAADGPGGGAGRPGGGGREAACGRLRAASGRGEALIVHGAALAVLAGFGWIVWIWSGRASQVDWMFLTAAPADAGARGGHRAHPGVDGGAAGHLPGGHWCPSGWAPPSSGGIHAAGQAAGVLVRRSLDVLAGVPSIVFGLFRQRALLQGPRAWILLAFRWVDPRVHGAPPHHPIGRGQPAGGPAGLRTPERGRPGDVASWRHRCLLLPAALAPGLLAGFVLGVGRALAETAALIFTSGYVDRLPSPSWTLGARCRCTSTTCR